jgi:Tol biopolymer transport system component/DNA-binding winged helix-turn-helix (wHTH) protein
MKDQSSVSTAKYRFGPFEATVRTGELRKFGVRVKLQTQPFTILLALLQRPGELVSREELRQLIWGSETIVDFDHSLSTAINKLREALSDSADRPRYIETLAKRGYRFVATVEAVPLPAPTAVEPTDTVPEPTRHIFETVDHSPVVLVEPPAERTTSILQPVSAFESRNFRRYAGLAIGALAIMGTAGWLLAVTSSPPQPAVRYAKITSSNSVYPGDISLERFPGVASDGIRIYFPEIKERTIVLSHASIAEGESYRILTPSEIIRPTVADVSPDGSNLLIRSMTWSDMEQPLWTVRSSGGAARKVHSGLAHDATWLPDGTSILYASGRDLFITDNQGGTPRKLANLPGRAFWIRYAPDGSSIRFTLLDPTTRATSLWELTPDGKTLKPLLPPSSKPGTECCGNWTRDGRYFLFQSAREGLSNIWVRKEGRFVWPFSHRIFQLTAGPLSFVAPSASQTSNRFFVIGTDPRTRLSRFDVSSGKAVPYLPNINTAERTALSPDNKRVVWISTVDRTLWRSDVDGTDRLQLTSRPMRVLMMRWSPDGTKIAFMAKAPDEPWRIYIISADGGNPTALQEGERNQADPDWSPDGAFLVYGHTPDYMSEDSTPKPIYIVNLASKRISTVKNSLGLFSPRWSPDGRFIVAMPLNQRKLMMFDFTTQSWSELATRSVHNPVWSADGKYVYFQAFLESQTPVYRVTIADRRLELITDFENLESADFANFLGVTPTNDPILGVRSLTADIYAVDWSHPW